MARAHVHRMLRLRTCLSSSVLVSSQRNAVHIILSAFILRTLCPTLVVIHPVVAPNCSLASSISCLNKVHLQKVQVNICFLCTDFALTCVSSKAFRVDSFFQAVASSLRWGWWDVVFEVNNQGRDFPKFRSSLP